MIDKQHQNKCFTDVKFRHIYILASRLWWQDVSIAYDSSQDLVLTYDFALKRVVEALGGKVYYVDHLCTQSEMQQNNFLAAEFFKKWHYDKNGSDIFTAKGISFGFAFRIEIWSEYLFYIRLRANLEKLHHIETNKIYIGENDKFISEIFDEMGLSYSLLNSKSNSLKSTYFFDIHKYMFEALHGRSLKALAKNALVLMLSRATLYMDYFFNSSRNKKNVYATIYHPTKSLVASLKKDDALNVITSSLSTDKGLRKFFIQRLIPIRGRTLEFKEQAIFLLNSFRKNRSEKLHLADGVEVSVGAYKVIERQIEPRLPEALRILNSVLMYVDKIPIDLEIMFANVGLLQTIVDCVLKEQKVPRYLIINGLMSGQFCDEAKYADYINSYSESIKQYYYDGAKNVVCLGDPRMDGYFGLTKAGGINRKIPTVTIGTSGFNNLDLNSYLAVEFEFMFDILTAFQELQCAGSKFNLMIKVRPNGFLDQYKQFTNEYFPNLKIEILSRDPMIDVLKQTDLYISIYSQTLFEASCLGVPVVYYKKDIEILDPPFDAKSELVTVDTIDTMKQAFLDFKLDHERFKPFLNKSVMEKYVGPLDGGNLERNLDFVYKLLKLKDIPELMQ